MIGHTESIQCYDPLENKQLFYTTVESSVESLAIVPAATKDQSRTILAGGMCTIQVILCCHQGRKRTCLCRDSASKAEKFCGCWLPAE